MRSALAKVPQIKDVAAEPGTPGTLSFQMSKGFEFRKALDAAIADGVSALKGYKVLACLSSTDCLRLAVVDWLSSTGCPRPISSGGLRLYVRRMWRGAWRTRRRGWSTG